LPVGWAVGEALVNYSGYCPAKGRYLRDEERIRDAVTAILDIYPRITYAYDTVPKAGYEVVQDKSRCCAQGDASRWDGSKGGASLDSGQLIPYQGIDDFLAANPDCCRFARTGLYGELTDADPWPQISGHSAGFVSARFRVRYRDATGNM